MIDPGKAANGEFCWVDLAANDAGKAKAFYRQMFGWTSCEQPANGGSFTRLRLAGQDIGSLYQLSHAHRLNGVPSHWTPYIRVDNVADAAARTAACGGTVIVQPFAVSDIARIALVLDSVGAPFGLWEPIASDQESEHGGKG